MNEPRVAEVLHFEDEPDRLGHRLALERFLFMRLGIPEGRIRTTARDEWMDEITVDLGTHTVIFRYVIYDDLARIPASRALGARLQLIDLMIKAETKGLDVYDQLSRWGYPDERIVFVTGLPDRVDRHIGNARKARVIEKPVSVASMFAVIWEAVRRDFQTDSSGGPDAKLD